MKYSTSRSAPPAPLAFADSQYSTPSSPASLGSSNSGDYTSAFPRSNRFNRRKDSSSSNKSSGSLGSWRKPSSPGAVNANSYCGRHSSQWLLSGWGIFRKEGV